MDLGRGDTSPDPGVADLFAYERIHDGQILRVVLNFGEAARAVPLPGSAWTVLLSTRAGPAEGVILPPA